MVCLFAKADLDEGAALGLEVNNHYLFAVKKADQIYLYWNRCPHLGTPLEWLENQFLDADGVLSPEISPDGVHLSPAGYAAWGDQLKPILNEVLGKMSIHHHN